MVELRPSISLINSQAEELIGLRVSMATGWVMCAAGTLVVLRFAA